MDINFNVGKNSLNNHSKKEDVKTTPPKKNSNKSTNDMKKKMVLFMAVVTIGIIALLLIAFVISIIAPRTYSYDDLEQEIKESAIAYFKDHKKSLPTTEDQIVEITTSTLVAEEYMKDLSEYTQEGVTCTGKVQVEKAGNDYLYSPYLNCGEEYTTEELYKVITKSSNIVTSGYGLYSKNGSYVYRGEEVNNYVKLDEAVWRIVKVTADNNIVLIKEEEAGQPLSWDNRYNSEKGYSSGINIYSASRIKEELNRIYKSNEKDEIFLSKEDKTKLLSYNVCAGKRSLTDQGTENTTECSSVVQDQKVGLLTASDYMAASVDEGCITTGSPSCQNYNYLTSGYDWWLVTAGTTGSDQVYYIDDQGSIELDIATGYASIRPVIQLNSKVLYKSGKGTKSKPYKIK